ncbi:peptide-methionine (R)-S-oxide reductase MsrB [Fibrella sp. HMF5335]|uniref:peptide-methionine (R)-S-oxide reductase n=1 Tax=Fibrella rubiginis TaxID=2817060 RepID=A0A939K6G0_9BACT|nr:peptide-methionine (R)-S-oxide reductase MsrB [Fibrella rubiginis]MBO0938291.1 peptide-methionine (R)-S-oxide reductase MsrB [Fibrella rubiginis]
MNQNKRFLLIVGLLLVAIWGIGTYFGTPRPPHQRPPGATSPGGRRVIRTDADWKAQLSRAQYAVLRESNTEWPNSSDLTHEKRPGVYVCAGCHNPLFSSKAKFESNTGWPSFFAPIVTNATYTEPDGNRTEIRCAVCDGHLGHVFPDGPEPTGLRYCINGDALLFQPD